MGKANTSAKVMAKQVQNTIHCGEAYANAPRACTAPVHLENTTQGRLN